MRMYFNSYVLIPLGVLVTDRAKLLGHSVETNQKRYSFEDLDYVDVVGELLNSAVRTPSEPPNVIIFQKEKASNLLNSRLLSKNYNAGGRT